MKRLVVSFYHWQTWLFLTVLFYLPGAASAHERFIQHTPKAPLHDDFFRRLDPNMLIIAGRVAGLTALMLFLWFLRQHPLDDFIEHRLLRNLKGKPKEWVHSIAAYVMDKPVEHPWFRLLSQWAVVLFLRCPALVLMFAAANKSLVMTSYPLEPSTTKVFQFVQVVMGLGILTQTLLPLGGATILGTFIYLVMAFDWKIAVDILPILTVAVVYVSSPWNSWNCSITEINRAQMRWLRFVLGFGFFALGWMKIYNCYLTVGVADNYPSIMQDPLVKMFYVGTNPYYARECWVMGFALCEVMTGFLIMTGVFSRVWCAMMVYLFTKLLVVDFGWPEIPHLYPVAAFAVVALSNSLSNWFYRVDERGDILAQKGKLGWSYIFASLGLAILIAGLTVYPMLYLLTKIPHVKYS
jgi:uncharacterized membrane protein YphA (DoxX/SURF4 family)